MSVKSPILTERDILLLQDLYKYKFLTSKQIQLLHFTAIQLTHRRLDKLLKAGLINRFSSDDVSSYIFYIDVRGINLLKNTNDLVNDESATINQVTPRNPLFLKHFLLINEFQIFMRIACNQSNINLRGFIPEYLGDGSGKHGYGRYIQDSIQFPKADEPTIHIPDAVFALLRKQETGLFFLEIDCGTETIGNPNKGLLKYLNFYCEYFRQQKFKRYEKDFDTSGLTFFHLLIVTSSQKRLLNIQKVIYNSSLPDEFKELIFLTAQSEISPKNFFNTIWYSGDPYDTFSYSILGKQNQINFVKF